MDGCAFEALAMTNGHLSPSQAFYTKAAKMSLTQAITRSVLAQEEYDRRFEKFCNAIVSEIEGGATILNTSASWDLGKDGRSLKAHGNIFTCSSLTDLVD